MILVSFKMGGEINLKRRERIGPILTLNIFNRNIGICLCHAKVERCFKIRNYTFPICSRCCGLLIGIPISIILLSLLANIPLIIAIFLVLPLIIDGMTQSFTKRFSNNHLRFFTGIMFSLGLFFILGGGG